MIYPRLKVARDLLTDDGVIFISIDDNEVDNLRKICDEIFGSKNFIAQIIWERAYAPINLMKHFSVSHDYVLCYAKQIDMAICHGISRSEEANGRYSNPDNDYRGDWKPSDISVGPAIKKNIYPITTPSGRVVYPPEGRSWRLAKDVFLEKYRDNRIWFGPKNDNVPSIKRFLSELKKSGITPMTLWKYTEVGHSQDATKSLASLFENKKFFDYPKPIDLIKRCIQLYTDDTSLILDFFSGSATTAHAVMQLNSEDGGNRKFIMVQLPEKTSGNSEAFKAGYKTICDIGKERIRRAGKKIIENLTNTGSSENTTPPTTDIGFRVFKLDSSNMEDVGISPNDINPEIDLFADNIKADRSSLDLLIQVMLQFGIELSTKIETKNINSKDVFFVNNNYLIACFDENIDESIIIEIAKLKPLYFVMRDSSVAADNVIDNFEQIFNEVSESTRRYII